MKPETKLPAEFDRKFSIHMYWVSHGPLLVRSGKSGQHSKRIDIVFVDVRWMALPVWFEGLRIEIASLSDIPLPITRLIAREAPYLNVYRLISEGVSHFVIAGGVMIAEDDEMYSANSRLLPDLDFRGLTTPLWDKAQPDGPANGGQPSVPDSTSIPPAAGHRR